MPLVKVMVDQIFFEANENGKPENSESTLSGAEEAEAIVKKEVRDCPRRLTLLPSS